LASFLAFTKGLWYKHNIVLLGDAKATAHYSIGSGTKLAMECGIALIDSIVKFGTNKEAAFAEYEKLRRNLWKLKLQRFSEVVNHST
jgi:anthraniloyl-CoA monooxygenase